MRILVVDDCQDTASSMQKLCMLLGYESLAVKNGLAAVDVAREYRPDIIIMDISMPYLDGYEAAKRIRSHEGGTEVVLVAMTGWGTDEDKRKAHDAGFDHHWLKPVRFEVMRELFGEIAAARAAAETRT